MKEVRRRGEEIIRERHGRRDEGRHISRENSAKLGRKERTERREQRDEGLVKESKNKRENKKRK